MHQSDPPGPDPSQPLELAGAAPGAASDAAAPPSERTRLRRSPTRGRYDASTIRAVLDAALICHVAVEHAGTPTIIPSAFARIGSWIYLHGSTANRVFRVIAGGAPVCIEVTHLDGIVLGRSGFHTSMNFRSVVVYGRGEKVTDPEHRLRALRATIEHVWPERFDDVRAPSREELLRTLIVRVPIDEASAKVRTGPPNDDAEDLALDCWAGVIPLVTHAGVPQPSPDLTPGIALPRYLEPAAVDTWNARPTAPHPSRSTGQVGG